MVMGSTASKNNVTVKYVEYEALVGRVMMNPGDRSAKKLMTDVRNKYLSMLKHPITQGKDGRWRTHVDDPAGKEKRRDIRGKTKEEVENKVIKALMEMEDRDKKKPVIDPNVTVLKYYDRWIEIQQVTNHATNSIQKYRSAKKRFFEPEWAKDFTSMRVVDVDYIDIENFLKCCITKYGLSAKAAHDPVSYTKQLFDTAVRDRLIPVSPFRECDVQKYVYPTCKETDVTDDGDKILSDEQVKDLIGAIETHLQKEPTYLPDYGILICLWSGLRVGEVPSRKWSEIQNGEIRVRTSEKIDRIDNGTGHAKSVYRISSTKTKKTRAIAICPSLQEVLDRIKAAQAEYGIESDYIMEGPDGRFTGSEIGKAAARRGKEAGIEHCSIQRIRRTVDSRLAGVLPFSAVCTQMGHGPEVDKQYYQFNSTLTAIRANGLQNMYLSPSVPKE